MSERAEPAATPAPRSLGRRLLTAAVVVLLVLVVPLAVAAAVGGLAALQSAAIGAIFGAQLALKGGWWRAALLLPVLVAVGGIGVLTVGGPWWVVLLGVLGLIAGLAAKWGLTGSVAMIGLVASSAHPLAGLGALPLHLALIAAAGGWVVAVARWLGIPARVDGPRLPDRLAVIGGIALGLLVGAAGWLAQLSSDDHAYWLPLMVFILAAPGPGIRWSRYARHRWFGTLAAVSLGGIVALLGLPGAGQLVLAVPFVFLTVAVTEPIWLNAMFSTFTVLMVLAPPGSLFAAAETRLVATTIAVVLVAVGIGALTWWGRRHPAPESEVRTVSDVLTAATEIGDRPR